jgi:hypothetical protein
MLDDFLSILLYLSQSSSVKRETSTFDWLVMQRHHEAPEEHFRKLGDKEDDRYWPVAVTFAHNP